MTDDVIKMLYEHAVCKQYISQLNEMLEAAQQRLGIIGVICDEYLERPPIADREDDCCDEEPSYCHDDARRAVAERIRRALNSDDPLLYIDALATTREVAEYLQLTENTVKSWRTKEQGPPWFAFEGTVRYRWIDIEMWLEAKGRPMSKNSPKSRAEGGQQVVLIDGKESKPQPKPQAPPNPRPTGE